MDFENYQKLANVTVNKTQSENEMLINAALGLCGESGEFADIVKKWRYQGHDWDMAKAKKELGDVLWYIALAASALGVSMDEIAEQNIEKLKVRYPGGFSVEKSVNRMSEL